MSAPAPAIVITTGEPAGIGPDICIALATKPVPGRPIFLANKALIEQRAGALDVDLTIETLPSPAAAVAHADGVMQLIDVPLATEVEAGKLDRANARYVLELLGRGTALCTSQDASALVTAPVHKSVIDAAGVPFTGHTEFLAELTGTPQPVMLLVSDTLRVALVTTHLPLAEVPKHIDATRLERVITVLHDDLETRFGIERPCIRVLGLNPHAGENGVLGREEIDVIAPTIERLRARGLTLLGPTPADTAFTGEALAGVDAVLAMYHDQGLPVIKAAAFGEVVNVTLGLPIIRTSVDHGTALELAATGRARADSLAKAYELAFQLANAAQ
ncbi:MAG: 4-hydroxythreonine-4-phosphate dehydrogenase PdxA [Gammaproteobacteria bacterium]|nr:4-hydroxythreonine-4-phosphate dehydrogenase PdxA [Gammaproteobacteria bacterium]